MHIEIVSHCYQYHRLLAYQLSSLILHPPQDCTVIMRVVCSLDSDPETTRIVHNYSRLAFSTNRTHDRVFITAARLTHNQLMRRAIGRNLACRRSCGDWLFLTDCDHAFGPNCLDSLAAALNKLPTTPQDPNFTPLCYPRYINRTSQPHGDDLINAVDLESITSPHIDNNTPTPLYSPPATTTPDRLNRAIGGVQIYHGDTARERGYLPSHTKWQKPAKTWQRTYEDKVFRGWLGTNGTPLDGVENLSRIRHSKRGREVKGLRL